jgi:L-lactate dehydrogenase complex protein LldG
MRDSAASTAARAEILTRIRAARSAVPPAGTVPNAVTEPEPPVVMVPRDYRGPGGAAGPGAAVWASLVDLLADRLADYGALVRRSPAAGAPAAITAVLHERAARRVAVPAGLPVDWIAALPEPRPDQPRLDIAELAAVDAVITSVTVAIAQTGTLVLDHGPGQGRRELTLVPDAHLALVTPGRIVAAVPDAVAALDPRSPLTWISGPSATSDIELNRVQGVHGPRTLIVIILDG